MMNVNTLGAGLTPQTLNQNAPTTGANQTEQTSPTNATNPTNPTTAAASSPNVGASSLQGESSVQVTLSAEAQQLGQAPGTTQPATTGAQQPAANLQEQAPLPEEPQSFTAQQAVAAFESASLATPAEDVEVRVEV